MPQSRMAIITFMEGHEPVDPGFSVPGYGGGYPSHGLPGGPNYPSHGLPGGGHIATLPVFPFDPTIDNSLPGQGGRPSNELPGSQPGIDNSLPGSGARPDAGLPRPGMKYVVKWLACQGLILVPDNSLPPTAEPK